MKPYFFLSAFSVCALNASIRNPFSYADGLHTLCCVSIGSLNHHEFFARIYCDGVLSTVRLHGRYGEYDVVRITAESITLKERSGGSHLLVLAPKDCTKKSPST